MINSDTPNLWEIKQSIGELRAKALIIYALVSMAELVNVERNLTDTQIRVLSEDILSGYGYMKVEEIKHVLMSAIRSQKVFGRIDYNVVMGWFKDYDDKRMQESISISEEKDLKERTIFDKNDNTMSWDEYVNSIKRKAESGDNDAKEKLREIENPKPTRMTLTSREDKHQKKLEFRQFFYNSYLKGKHKSR